MNVDEETMLVFCKLILDLGSFTAAELQIRASVILILGLPKKFRIWFVKVIQRCI